MATQSSRLTIQPIGEHGDIMHVGFLDRNILEEATIQQIGDEISQLIDNTNQPKILLDFQNVEHLSSAALGQLITINNKIKQKGGQFRLCNIDDQIKEVFIITRLNKLFHILDDVENATASFK